MNKKQIQIVVAIVIVIILAGIWYFQKPTPASGEPIKIGAIMILSGDGSLWGEASKNGMELAIEEINKDGGINGRPLEGIYEDYQSDPSKSVSAFNKLITSDKVRFIIGPNWSDAGLALKDLAEQAGVVMISPSLGLKEFNEDNDYLFNTWPHDNILSGELADYVFEEGYRNVALIGANNVWVKDQTSSFVNRFEELGGVISYLYEPTLDTTDLRAEITKIKNNKSVEAVVLTTDGYGLTVIASRQIREQGITLPLFNITVDNKVVADCGQFCEGMIFPTFLTPTRQFETKYKNKYDRDIEIGADSAYDAVMMLAESIRETNSTDPENVKVYLAGIREYDGVSGNLISDGKRGFTKDFIVKMVKDSEVVTIKSNN